MGVDEGKNGLFWDEIKVQFMLSNWKGLLNNDRYNVFLPLSILLINSLTRFIIKSIPLRNKNYEKKKS